MTSPHTFFQTLFELRPKAQARPPLLRADAPRTLPDPQTGHPLKVANVEVSDRSVCPACTTLGSGAYVSFEADLRLVFACASCQTLVWIAGA